MSDLKWQHMKQKMRDECARVAKAWGVPVTNVELRFSTDPNEPELEWGIWVRVEPKDKRRRVWQAHGYGQTFEEAADECIERKQFSPPHELP